MKKRPLKAVFFNHKDLRLFDGIECAADGRFLARRGVGMIYAVGRGSVDNGNGLGEQLLGEGNVFGFDGGVEFLDGVLHAGFLCDVLRILLLGNQHSFFGGFDVGHFILLLRYMSYRF